MIISKDLERAAASQQADRRFTSELNRELSILKDLSGLSVWSLAKEDISLGVFSYIYLSNFCILIFSGWHIGLHNFLIASRPRVSFQTLDLSVSSLHVLSQGGSLWALSVFCVFLPQSKHIYVR